MIWFLWLHFKRAAAAALPLPATQSHSVSHKMSIYQVCLFMSLSTNFDGSFLDASSTSTIENPFPLFKNLMTSNVKISCFNYNVIVKCHSIDIMNFNIKLIYNIKYFITYFLFYNKIISCESRDK